jgi:hypothetical protein
VFAGDVVLFDGVISTLATRQKGGDNLKEKKDTGDADTEAVGQRFPLPPFPVSKGKDVKEAEENRGDRRAAVNDQEPMTMMENDREFSLTKSEIPP